MKAPTSGSAPWKDQAFWDNRFRTDDVPWDLDAPSETLIHLQSLKNRDRSSLRMIVPGAGYGNDAVAFAKLGYSGIAVEWSPAAAQVIRERTKGNPGLEVREGSVWDLPTSWQGTFDLWVEHTFFCAIDPSMREAYVKLAAAHLKPGGEILGNFFISSATVTEPSLNAERGGGPPFVTSESDFRALFSPSFEILEFAPSRFPHPERRPGLEWAAWLRRR